MAKFVCLVTVGACKWLFSCVNHLVTPAKLIVTFGAGKWFFSCVGPLMLFQLILKIFFPFEQFVDIEIAVCTKFWCHLRSIRGTIFVKSGRLCECSLQFCIVLQITYLMILIDLAFICTKIHYISGHVSPLGPFQQLIITWPLAFILPNNIGKI